MKGFLLLGLILAGGQTRGVWLREVCQTVSMVIMGSVWPKEFDCALAGHTCYEGGMFCIGSYLSLAWLHMPGVVQYIDGVGGIFHNNPVYPASD